ncbi:hypothetical protein CCUS01_10717 [Colletotrichum cuscutae]|uniref:Uncharacterized protein n=1 Tax=Colletotrichum cuscutae TaxID=1209917 RepID=A0AAI9XKT8_9PEZI|nr:hypothetical protein CCUS01_10717 [Colletotrichum cuscutae]
MSDSGTWTTGHSGEVCGASEDAAYGGSKRKEKGRTAAYYSGVFSVAVVIIRSMELCRSILFCAPARHPYEIPFSVIWRGKYRPLRPSALAGTAKFPHTGPAGEGKEGPGGPFLEFAWNFRKKVFDIFWGPGLGIVGEAALESGDAVYLPSWPVLVQIAPQTRALVAATRSLTL